MRDFALGGCTFSGANESYMTRPTAVRDRYLLNKSLRFSRGLANIPCQIFNVPAFHPKDTDNESTIKSLNGLVQTVDEDLLLPWHVSPSLCLLPVALKEIGSHLYDYTPDICDTGHCSETLDYDRDQRMERSLELIQTLFQESQ